MTQASGVKAWIAYLWGALECQTVCRRWDGEGMGAVAARINRIPRNISVNIVSTRFCLSAVL